MDDGRRRDPRFEMVTDARVTGVDGLVGDRALDVSASGLRVRALADVQIGDSERVSLRIPNTDTWVSSEGVVTRRIEGRRVGDQGRSFGIRFRGMRALSRRVLTSAACWFDEAAKGRGDRRAPARALRRRESDD